MEALLCLECELIASAHLACGVASGIFVQKYLSASFGKEWRWGVALFAGIISHLILDAWPHWEYPQHGHRLLVILLIETTLVLVGIFSIKRSQTVNLLLFMGMVGGAMPDLSLMVWERLFFWGPLLYFYFMTHIFHSSLPFFEAGLVLQLILVAVAVIYVQFKSV